MSLSDVITQCPFCAYEKLNYECRYPDHKYEIIKIYSCDRCGVFIPEYKTALYTTVEQIKLHENMWISQDKKEWLDAKNGMVDMIEKQKHIIGDTDPSHLVLDIGAGRANLSAALNEHGYHFASCEPSEGLYTQAIQNYNLDSSQIKNIDAMTFLEETVKSMDGNTKIITIYLWHVLEHIKDSKKVLDFIVKYFSCKRLNIMIQMPMLKSEYIFPEHYFLATPDWYYYLQKFMGLKLVDFSQSNNRMFISGFYSNNCNLNEFKLKRPFRSLTQTERLLYSNLNKKD